MRLFLIVFLIACGAIAMVPSKKLSTWIEVKQVLIPLNTRVAVVMESIVENQNQTVRAVRQLQREVDLLKEQRNLDDGKRAVSHEEPVAQ